MPPAKQLRAVFHLSLFNQPTNQPASLLRIVKVAKRDGNLRPRGIAHSPCASMNLGTETTFSRQKQPHTFDGCCKPILGAKHPSCQIAARSETFHSHSLPRHRYLALLHHPYCKIVLPTAPTIAQGCMCVVSLRCSLRPTLTCLGAVESRAKC